jgi:outer membrane protein assembly factor BamB
MMIRMLSSTIISLFLLPFVLNANTTVDSWPIFRGDRSLTGSVENGKTGTLKLAWRSKTRQEIIASPVYRDGIVYIATMDGDLIALESRNGKKAWARSYDTSFEAAPLIVDNLLVIGTAEGSLIALDINDGAPVWEYKTEGKIIGSATWFILPKNGRKFIICGSYDNYLHCIEMESGRRAWVYQTDNFINGTASIGDNSISFGGCDGRIHILDFYGRKTATIEVGSYIAGSVSSRDSTLYGMTYSGTVVAVALDSASKKWSVQPGGEGATIVASPSVSGEFLIAASKNGFSYTIDLEKGKSAASFYAGAPIEASPLTIGASTFIATMDGTLFLYETATGREIWNYDAGVAIAASPAFFTGYLVVAATDGYVYAFKQQ